MLNSYLVNFIGSIFYVYIVLATGNPIAVGAALALFGLIAKGIHGASVNPTVTITMAAAGKLTNVEIIPLCISQILGGLVALELYKRIQIEKVEKVEN